MTVMVWSQKEGLQKILMGWLKKALYPQVMHAHTASKVLGILGILKKKQHVPFLLIVDEDAWGSELFLVLDALLDDWSRSYFSMVLFLMSKKPSDAFLSRLKHKKNVGVLLKPFSDCLFLRSVEAMFERMRQKKDICLWFCADKKEHLRFFDQGMRHQQKIGHWKMLITIDTQEDFQKALWQYGFRIGAVILEGVCPDFEKY